MLKDQFKYYIENQEELLKKYDGEFIVIKDLKVVGNYKDKESAYNESIKKYPIGTFLIQHCTPGKNDYSQTFTSRVIFD